MKKIISLALVCVLLVGAALALAACGKTLSGKYSYEFLGVEAMSLDFSGNKVSLVIASQEEQAIEGTYEISENDKGKTVISFDFGEEDAADDFNGELAFEEGDGFIKIAGVKYEKVK